MNINNEIDPGKFDQLLTSISKLDSNQKPRLKVWEDGSIHRSNEFSAAMEKLSQAFGGQVDMTKSKFVGVALMKYLDYAISNPDKIGQDADRRAQIVKLAKFAVKLLAPEKKEEYIELELDTPNYKNVKQLAENIKTFVYDNMSDDERKKVGKNIHDGIEHIANQVTEEKGMRKYKALLPKVPSTVVEKFISIKTKKQVTPKGKKTEAPPAQTATPQAKPVVPTGWQRVKIQQEKKESSGKMALTRGTEAQKVPPKTTQIKKADTTPPEQKKIEEEKKKPSERVLPDKSLMYKFVVSEDETTIIDAGEHGKVIIEDAGDREEVTGQEGELEIIEVPESTVAVPTEAEAPSLAKRNIVPLQVEKETVTQQPVKATVGEQPEPIKATEGKQGEPVQPEPTPVQQEIKATELKKEEPVQPGSPYAPFVKAAAIGSTVIAPVLGYILYNYFTGTKDQGGGTEGAAVAQRQTTGSLDELIEQSKTGIPTYQVGTKVELPMSRRTLDLGTNATLEKEKATYERNRALEEGYKSETPKETSKESSTFGRVVEDPKTGEKKFEKVEVNTGGSLVCDVNPNNGTILASPILRKVSEFVLLESVPEEGMPTEQPSIDVTPPTAQAYTLKTPTPSENITAPFAQLGIGTDASGRRASIEKEPPIQDRGQTVETPEAPVYPNVTTAGKSPEAISMTSQLLTGGLIFGVLATVGDVVLIARDLFFGKRAAQPVQQPARRQMIKQVLPEKAGIGVGLDEDKDVENEDEFQDWKTEGKFDKEFYVAEERPPLTQKQIKEHKDFEARYRAIEDEIDEKVKYGQINRRDVPRFGKPPKDIKAFEKSKKLI